MKIEKFVLGPMGTNCYIAVNEENEECFFVDPAAWPPELSSHIRTGGEKPLAVLLTHGHFDHIMGLDGLLKEYDIPVYALENEKDILNSGPPEPVCHDGNRIYVFRRPVCKRRTDPGSWRNAGPGYPYARAYFGRMLAII